MSRHLFVVGGMLGVAAFAWSCGGPLESATSTPAQEANVAFESGADADDIARPVILSEEPWTFAGATGSIVRTRHYRLYTTLRDRVLLERTTEFLERGLVQYRNALGSLPAPPRRLDTYLMANRPQWERLTRSLLGDGAQNVLRLQRGGFASRGIGVYFDLGMRDTLKVAAHEGWHQYTQRTFRERLPVWLEEGIATYMEGHRWVGPRPVFRSWANLERYDELRAAHARGTLLDLPDLLYGRPNDFLELADGSGLTYYAQVWALAHFLDEGGSGRYALRLRQLLNDAAIGELGSVLRRRLGGSGARAAQIQGGGPGVFLAYFNMDLTEASREYRRFVEQVVSVGGRDRIASGTSPIAIGDN